MKKILLIVSNVALFLRNLNLVFSKCVTETGSETEMMKKEKYLNKKDSLRSDVRLL